MSASKGERRSVAGELTDRSVATAKTEEKLQPGEGEITLLLGKWRDGEPSAFEQLMPLVYPHLRQVAAAYIGRERNPDLLE